MGDPRTPEMLRRYEDYLSAPQGTRIGQAVGPRGWTKEKHSWIGDAGTAVSSRYLAGVTRPVIRWGDEQTGKIKNGQ